MHPIGFCSYNARVPLVVVARPGITWKKILHVIRLFFEWQLSHQEEFMQFLFCTFLKWGVNWLCSHHHFLLKIEVHSGNYSWFESLTLKRPGGVESRQRIFQHTPWPWRWSYGCQTSCNYHFWCLWQEKNKKFLGFIEWFLLEKFLIKIFFFFLQKVALKILKHSICLDFLLSNCTFQHQISI